ncbi:MAG: hypothetical protein ABIS23_03885 [Sphingomicrobium sp.]
MRLLFLVPALGLSLAACGKSETENQNAGRAMTAEAISSNDVTAIDAVTGEAANMAADVDITRELNAGANGASPVTGTAGTTRRPKANAAEPRPAAGSSGPAEQPETPSQPESNSAE